MFRVIVSYNLLSIATKIRAKTQIRKTCKDLLIEKVCNAKISRQYFSQLKASNVLLLKARTPLLD